MWTFWFLGLGLLLGFTTFTTSEKDTPKDIPGCGDTGTTAAPPADNPKHFAVYTDKHGCKLKVIGTWMTKEDPKRLPDSLRRVRASSGRVKLPASCQKICNDTVKNFPEGTPCRLVTGDPIKGKNHIKDGCIRGYCSSGVCVSDKRNISCYVPPNNTELSSPSGSFAE
uniref:Evasin n=1 Tax=Amblyomma maculatum TaxID=34609 RepID=G3MKK4_AMBMU